MWARLHHPRLAQAAVTVVGVGSVQSLNLLLPGTPSRHDLFPKPFRLFASTSVQCSPKAQRLPCTTCGEVLDRSCFSPTQLHRPSHICSVCTSANAAAQPGAALTLLCSCCGELVARSFFARDSWKRTTRVCSGCAEVSGDPRTATTRICAS